MSRSTLSRSVEPHRTDREAGTAILRGFSSSTAPCPRSRSASTTSRAPTGAPPSSPAAEESFTLEAWLRLAPGAGDSAVFGNNAPGSAPELFLYVRGDHSPYTPSPASASSPTRRPRRTVTTASPTGPTASPGASRACRPRRAGSTTSSVLATATSPGGASRRPRAPPPSTGQPPASTARGPATPSRRRPGERSAPAWPSGGSPGRTSGSPRPTRPASPSATT